jgi:uncharacterized protein YndB with AHSA1/START domain
MSVNERTIEASVDAVWEVLSDGWLYPTWVVGATRMRDVDHAWPATGSRLHHSAGVWPLVVNDETRVEAVDPPRRLELRAKGWPLGEADVLIELEPVADGTLVRIHEDAMVGPGRVVPKALRTPVMKWRNSETLRRLAFICEGRVEGHTPHEAR